MHPKHLDLGTLKEITIHELTGTTVTNLSSMDSNLQHYHGSQDLLISKEENKEEIGLPCEAPDETKCEKMAGR